MQPFLKVTLKKISAEERFSVHNWVNHPDTILINEAHVVSVKPHKDGSATLSMSNGMELIVTNPAYEEWDNDVYVRKF